MCPAIRGVTIRTHGESGVPEGEYGRWKTIFDGAAQCGRPVGIDLHAKGVNQQMINAALDTGLPVTVSPKFWAEHMGLPYMQGAIRALEMPPKNAPKAGLFTLSAGSRSFMRYGYGDLLTENRRYGVLQNVAKSLGYANANAGRFVGMDVVDPAIDFKALAASMGVPAEPADSRDTIGAAVQRALGRDGPSLIEIPIR